MKVYVEKINDLWRISSDEVSALVSAAEAAQVVSLEDMTEQEMTEQDFEGMLEVSVTLAS